MYLVIIFYYLPKNFLITIVNILFMERQNKALKIFCPKTWCTKKTFRLSSHTPLLLTIILKSLLFFKLYSTSFLKHYLFSTLNTVV